MDNGALKKKGVLLVGNFLSQNGHNRGVCEDLAKQLLMAGWSVITTSHKSARIPRLADMLITIFQRRMAYAIAQVDVYSGKAFIWAEAACWLLRYLGKPYILTLHGGDLPLFAHRWSSRVHRLLNSAMVVTTPSPYLLNSMIPYRSDLHLLENPIDISVYNFRLRRKPQPRLIWLRAFHTIYNPNLALQVESLLVEAFPDIHMTMIGPDKGDGSLQATRRAAEAFGLNGRVIFPGGVPKSEVPQWLNTGDIFINTTNVDNTPISVLEAMACGLCVVSTNVGGIPHLLEHKQSALLVPPNDPESMAAAVRRILSEPGLAEHLSRNARRKAEQFDWSVILPRWEKLFNNLAC